MKGFSLIEMVIVITLISLIAMFGLSRYQQHIQQAQQLLAQSALQRLSLAMENYFVQHHTYEGATLDNLHFPTHLTNGYEMDIKEQNNNAYVLVARGKTGDVLLSSEA